MTSDYREDAEFRIQISLTAEFGESYEGDEDGYAWLARWRADVKPRLLRAVFDALRESGHFDAVPVARGVNPDEQSEIAVRLRVTDGRSLG